MDFMTILSYVLEILETGALIGGLIFLTKAIKEKKDTSARKSQFIRGGVFLALFILLNVIGNLYF